MRKFPISAFGQEILGSSDSEIIKRAMPADVNSADLRKSLTGQWTSPRHNYLYRTDGTLTMLPEVIDGEKTTHGVWHIEGNKFFQHRQR